MFVYHGISNEKQRKYILDFNPNLSNDGNLSNPQSDPFNKKGSPLRTRCLIPNKQTKYPILPIEQFCFFSSRV